MSTVRFTDGSTTVSFDGLSRESFHIAESDGDGEQLTAQHFVAVRSTGAAALADIQSLTRMFRRATERWQGAPSISEPRNGHIERVFCEIDRDGDGTWYRAEITAGRAGADTEALSDMARAQYTRFPIAFTHTPGWEGPEAALTLNNGNGSTANGLTLDLANQAYFTVAAAAIGGNMPARCRLELTNTTNNAARCETIWVGLLRSPLGSGSGWPARYAISTTQTWSGTGQVQVFSKDIPVADMAITRGRRIKPVIRFNTVPSSPDIMARAVIMYGSTELAGTPWQLLNNLKGMHECFSLRLPPKYIGSNPAAHTLVLYARKQVAAGNAALDVDCVWLMAAEQFCRFKPAGYNLPYAFTLVADSIENTVYSTDGTSRIGNYDAQGGAFTLMPGLLHTFNVAHVVDLVGTTPATRTMAVKLYYRPRRSTL